MARRGERPDDGQFEAAVSGTVYWTLSLYVEPEKVADALGLPQGGYLDAAFLRRIQMGHMPSFALRNAIDPLLNDIADRDMQGEVREFLLAAGGEDSDDLDEAAALVRGHEDLTFALPPSISWTTEGVRFHAHPPGLDDPRAVRLRRFWFAHNNGALSYHLSFSHFYASYVDGAGEVRSGYDPATYYFLSMLQKLAAPKEYTLDPALLRRLMREGDPRIDVFSDETLDIDPLDRILVTGAAGPELTFWRFVRRRFEADARTLFARFAAERGGGAALAPGFEKQLLDMVPFIEVPGLQVPKSRFMFLLHDERFFDRLMPLDDRTKATAPRKAMVQEGCYAAYGKRLAQLTAWDGGRPTRALHLGAPPGAIGPGERQDADFWTWAVTRPEYARGLAAGAYARRARDPGAPPVVLAPGDLAGLTRAMRAGECVQVRALDGAGSLLDEPVPLHIPAFDAARADCLDYLFLSGFNQNIIDFMNQDTSEILDSIDPIYPRNDEQSDERFFVRYANHRAMITYLPRSRSLEAGNDYIGTCPYAFLIHVLALHNEFLARRHEERSMARIERVDALIAGRAIARGDVQDVLARREPLEPGTRFEQAEFAINQAKLAEFAEYERFRYANPFRYDTERDVFTKLEELRGTSRKQQALGLAIRSLEDHASDLKRRNQRAADDATARRDARLNILLGGTGVFGAGQMFYWVGEKASEGRQVMALYERLPGTKAVGDAILSTTEVAMDIALMVFLPLLVWIIVDTIRELLQSRDPAGGAARSPSDPAGGEGGSGPSDGGAGTG